MTRVTSQKVRQAVLVTGDPLDANELPEKLQLFNELGEPLMMGGGYARYSKDVTSTVLDAGEGEARVASLYPSARIFKVATSAPARVRLYPTLAQLEADEHRGIGIRPRGNHGRLLEIVTTLSMLELDLSPVVDITSTDATVPAFHMHVTNLSGGSGAITTTFHYFRTE